MSEQKEQTLPLFYKNPQPINAEQHGQLGITPANDFSFAKHANSIPLVTSEFAEAAKHYPIVFLKGAIQTSLIITGFRDGENVFIDHRGEWQKNTYIPGYVNRYPFIFLEDAENDQLVLCMDIDASVVSKNGEIPLFKDEKPTDFAEKALKTCTEYQGYLNATREFVAALETADLLTENQAELTGADGKVLRLTGFCVIDEDKFKGLSEDVILDWHKKGWLYLIYAHFISTSNWSKIAALTQPTPEPEPTETIH